jgi:hypothetical protein
MRQIAKSILNGILLWCLVGIGVSVLVSAVLISAYAIFIFKDALAPAFFSGAVQGIWLYAARNGFATRKDLICFGVISGAALGLLDFVPVYVTTTACFGWWYIGWFVIAAIAGGSSAGYLNSWVHVSDVRSRTRSAWKTQAVLGALLFFCAAGFEYEHYGASLLERMPALRVSERVIAEMHSGNATGTARSGSYQYSGQLRRSCVVGSNGGVMEIREQDGNLQAYVTGMWLKGGINADGTLWAAGQRSSTTDRNSILRDLLVGRFRNETEFEYTLRSSLIVNGSTKNTTMERGAGRRLRP